MALRFKSYIQRSDYDCGPTCLRIISRALGKTIPEWTIFEKVGCSTSGWSIKDFCEASEHFGLKANVTSLDNIDLLKKVKLPVVLLINNHYVVLAKYKLNKVFIIDPIQGKLTFSLKEFSKWINSENFLIYFELTPEFKNLSFDKKSYVQAFRFLKSYLYPYRKHILGIISITLVVTLAQVSIPFLSKAVIDIGLKSISWNFIQLLLVANLFLILSTLLGRVISTVLTTHITNRIKVNMLDDFIHKLFKLPDEFFERTNIGDLLQRIRDNERVQSYLTNQFFTIGISAFLLILFSLILLYFSTRLFLIYAIGSLLYLIWTVLFLNQRKKIDLRIYELLAKNNKYAIEIHKTSHDIKIFNLIDRFQNKWRNNLIDQHEISITFLKVNQIHEFGAALINQVKNLGLTYLTVYYVLNGEMSLGILFSIQYIIGNLNGPLNQVVSFLNQTQLAHISLSRVFEFYNYSNRVEKDKQTFKFIPKHKDIRLQNINKRFPDGTFGLRSFSLEIKQGQKVGIVGKSGCGKSTLLKTIAGISEPSSGDIYIGTSNIQGLNIDYFRNEISMVLQDSKLFEGSVLENITGVTVGYNEDKLIKAVEGALIRREIESWKDGYNTQLEGANKKLSMGQYHRVLLARALYKDASIYLFDEISSSLSNDIEQKIFDKIDKILNDKTRLIVSHRLAPIIDCDVIYVIENGVLAEAGTHTSLVNNKSFYYRMFKGQIETESLVLN